MDYEERQEQEEVWREMFRLFDSENNGHVTALEMGMLLRGLGMHFTQRDLQENIQKMDRNGTGVIEWEEFLHFMQQREESHTHKQQDDVMQAFKLFEDNTDDDRVEVNELRRVLTSRSCSLMLEEAKEIVSDDDLDKDGRINYKELVKFIFAPCCDDDTGY